MDPPRRGPRRRPARPTQSRAARRMDAAPRHCRALRPGTCAAMRAPVLLRRVARDLGQRLVQARRLAASTRRARGGGAGGGGAGGGGGGGRGSTAACGRRLHVAALASSAPLSAGLGGGRRFARRRLLGRFRRHLRRGGRLGGGPILRLASLLRLLRRRFPWRLARRLGSIGVRGDDVAERARVAVATFPFAKRQACFDFFFFFAAGASAGAGAAAAGAAAVASSERFKMRTVGVALLLRAAARAAAQALDAAIMSNARESCASITASEGMADGEPCDCFFCGARRDLLIFPLSLGAILMHSSRERCWPAVACAGTWEQAMPFGGEQFCKEL